MENYNQFLDRILSFEKKEFSLGNNDFSVNPNLLHKVDINNRFSPFFGDTVVFDLDDEVKNILSSMVYKLYNSAPECFCEKLCSNTFHITLHDLNNSTDFENVATDIKNTETKLREKLKTFPLNEQSITFKSNYVFNMVNTSLVLGLVPSNKVEYLKLMELYNFVDEIKSLPYPFTPHITLAYYNRNGFSATSSAKLEKVVNEINENTFDFSVSSKMLFYQKFNNMNDFNNVFRFC